jgi:hypothetical protein
MDVVKAKCNYVAASVSNKKTRKNKKKNKRK